MKESRWDQNTTSPGKALETLRQYRDAESESSQANIEDLMIERYPYGYAKNIGKDFFCLAPDTELSDADAEDLERFMQYAGKRLVIGHLGSPANERKTQKEKVEYDATGFAIHEIGHAVAAYARGRQNSVIPEMLSKPKDVWYTDQDVLAEEMIANLWNDPESLQAVVEGGLPQYIEMTRELLRYGAQSDPRIIDGSFDAAMDALKKEPNVLLVELVQRVREGYSENPNILLAEFHRICDPLLERLRNSSEYTVERMKQRDFDGNMRSIARRLAEIDRIKGTLGAM